MCTSNFNRCVWMWWRTVCRPRENRKLHAYMYIFENHTTYFQESKIICWKKESGIISCARHAVENGIHFIYFSRKQKNVNRIHQINDNNANRIGLKQSSCLCVCFCVSSSRMDLIINIFFVFLSALIM